MAYAHESGHYALTLGHFGVVGPYLWNLLPNYVHSVLNCHSRLNIRLTYLKLTHSPYPDFRILIPILTRILQHYDLHAP